MRLTIVERYFSVWLSQNCSLEMLEDARLWGELITPKAEESFPRVMSRNAWYEVDVHTDLAFTCDSCLWFWNELKKCTNIKYAWQLTPHNSGHFKDSLFLCSTRYCCPVLLSPTYSFLMLIPSFKASMHIQKPRSAGCFIFWYSPPSAPDKQHRNEGTFFPIVESSTNTTLFYLAMVMNILPYFPTRQGIREWIKNIFILDHFYQQSES